jgi:Putative beta-lactamase-inhibitor-like, PepSY-like
MRISTLALALLACGATVATAQETKIQRSDLPVAVEKAVAAQSANATIHGYSKEKEGGQTYYEAEMTVDGHSKDVLFNESGGVVEVEEQVTFDSLPAPVQQGLKDKAGEGKILKIESLTRHDKLVAYEAVVQKSGKKSEIQVSPVGKPIDHEE